MLQPWPDSLSYVAVQDNALPHCVVKMWLRLAVSCWFVNEEIHFAFGRPEMRIVLYAKE